MRKIFTSNQYLCKLNIPIDKTSLIMKKYPIILSIAGSDCSGGAGIQADIKTISSLGAYAATAITAITVQNTLGVHAIHAVPPKFVKGQIEAVMDDLKPDAVKIGMINDIDIVHILAEVIRKYRPRHVVFDPVMVSTSGYRLLEEKAIEAITQELIPLTSLITPNLDEAEILCNSHIRTLDEMKKAASDLLWFGSQAVLLKGGHLMGNEKCDVLQLKGVEITYIYKGHNIDSPNVHGTGCTLSSAIATFLALGNDMPEAVNRAKTYIQKAIETGKDIRTGQGNGPLNHLYNPQKMQIIKQNE